MEGPEGVRASRNTGPLEVSPCCRLIRGCSTRFLGEALKAISEMTEPRRWQKATRVAAKKRKVASPDASQRSLKDKPIELAQCAGQELPAQTCLLINCSAIAHAHFNSLAPLLALRVGTDWKFTHTRQPVVTSTTSLFVMVTREASRGGRYS